MASKNDNGNVLASTFLSVKYVIERLVLQAVEMSTQICGK